MRLGLCSAGLIIGLAACSEAKLEQARNDYGCGPIDGLNQIAGKNQPAYVLVGEFTETNEAPAAFAEIACNLAAGGRLYVGVSEFLGGATDAETRMRQRIDGLVAKGAPITVGVISDPNRGPRNRTDAERRWAGEIMAKVAASGARRALLLAPHADARDAPYQRSERFAGYEPMPMHLPKGQVMSLEIATAPAPGLQAPAVRIYPKMIEGFHGQIALASLTRSAIPLVMPTDSAALDQDIRSSGIEAAALETILRTDMPREKKIALAADYLRSHASAATERALGPLGSYLDQRRAEVMVTAHERLEELQQGSLNTDVRLEMPEPVVNLPEFKAED